MGHELNMVEDVRGTLCRILLRCGVVVVFVPGLGIRHETMICPCLLLSSLHDMSIFFCLQDVPPDIPINPKKNIDV